MRSSYSAGKFSGSDIAAKEAAFRAAKAKVDRMVAGGENALSRPRDRFATAVQHEISSRPYSAVLLALGVGFVLGASWRR